METILDLEAWAAFWALGVAVLAGFVKGAVGFAMPMIMISGLSAVLSAEAALAALILPTLITNTTQALRQGPRLAWQTIRRFRVFLLIGFVCLAGSAQLVPYLPSAKMYIILGATVTVFAVILLLGLRFHVRPEKRTQTEIWVGALAGSVGGMSGIWGPPTVAYLTAIDTPKAEHVRSQGVIYGLGALALMGAHMNTGIFSTQTLPLAVALLIPAMAGMWIGYKIHDRLDQARFRRMTLIVLIVAGLNLIRRGLMG